MAKEDTPLDQGVFDSTLEAELAKGTDRRVAEGRARSSRFAPSAPRTRRKPPSTKPPGVPAAAAASSAGGNGGATAAPAAASATAAGAAMGGAPVAVAASVTTPVREAPLPTGNLPTPKKGADDKHRLLALVPPEGIQRVEREQGDRVNVWPHLLIEEFVAMFILLAG